MPETCSYLFIIINKLLHQVGPLVIYTGRDVTMGIGWFLVKIVKEPSGGLVKKRKRLSREPDRLLALAPDPYVLSPPDKKKKKSLPPLGFYPLLSTLCTNSLDNSKFRTIKQRKILVSE